MRSMSTRSTGTGFTGTGPTGTRSTRTRSGSPRSGRVLSTNESPPHGLRDRPAAGVPFGAGAEGRAS